MAPEMLAALSSMRGRGSIALVARKILEEIFIVLLIAAQWCRNLAGLRKA